MESVQNSDWFIGNNLRRIGKNTLIYSVGNIAIKIVSFLFIPLYTNYLQVYEVGVIVLLELLELLYISVVPLGTISAIWRFFYSAQAEGNERRYVSSNYFFMMAVNLFFLLGLIMASNFIAQHFLSNEAYTQLLSIFFIALFFSLSRFFILNLLRIFEKAFHFLALVLCDFVFLVSLTIWLVVGVNLGLSGVIYGKLIAAGAVFVYTLVYVLRNFGIKYCPQDVKRSLKYGLPLIFHGMGLLILGMSDRFFIKEIISVQAGGVYGIAYKFGMIMNMLLVTPFVQAWQPILFQLEDHPNQKLIYQKTALHFVQVGALVWLSIAVLSKYLLSLTTPEEYDTGIVIIPWVAFSYLLYGLQNIFKAGALINNHTVKLTVLTLLSAIANIVLNIVLITRWGLIGAATATLLSYLIMMLLVLRLSQEYLYINWLWKKMLLIIFLSLGVYSLSLSKVATIQLNLVKDIFVVLLLPVLMVALKLVSLKEVKRFIFSFQSVR